MNFTLMIPEFTALGILLTLLLGEMFLKDFSQKLASKTAFAGALIVTASLLLTRGNTGSTFGGTFTAGEFSFFFKLFFALAILPVIQMSQHFFESRLKHPGEFFLILWSTLIGLFFLSSASDFLLMFISLEIVTLSFYIMAAYLKRDLYSIESGLKYLILGSLASAFFIYGISLLYVATGSTSLAVVHNIFQTDPSNKTMLLGLILLISGIGFKIASVPFHLWVADVYEGAPTPVVSHLSVASKAAGFLIALKVLFLVFPAFESGRAVLFSVLAAMTILYGNLAALVQTNIKRLFGYSSIGHAGYLMIGVAAGGTLGTESTLFYLLAYGVTNLTAFMVITLVGHATGSDRIDTYQGLSKRSPFLAAIMFLSLLSLAGIPPLAGFFGKFMVLLSAVSNGLGHLALLGALAVAISLFYYLNLVRKMYVDESADNSAIQIPQGYKITLSVLASLILVMGLWQAPFLAFAHQAAASLF